MDRGAKPLGRPIGDGPALSSLGVECVEDDDGDRRVEKEDDEPRPDPQAGLRELALHQSASNARARLASARHMAMTMSGTEVNAAANGRSPDAPRPVL